MSERYAGKWDQGSSWILGAYDAYGWIPQACMLILLAALFLGFLCWLMEDLPMELELFRAPGAIFRWTRRNWRVRTGNLLKLS